MRTIEKLRVAFKHGYTVDIETGNVFGLRGQLLKPQKIRTGHLVVTLQTPGLNRRNECVVSVHSIVAYAKYGEKAFLPSLEIRHLNGIAHDNRGANLEPGTRQQNIMDIPLEERKKIAIKRTRHLLGKPNCNRSLSDKEINIIKNRLINAKRGIVTILSKEFNVSHTTISNIKRGVSYESVE